MDKMERKSNGDNLKSEDPLVDDSFQVFWKRKYRPVIKVRRWYLNDLRMLEERWPDKEMQEYITRERNTGSGVCRNLTHVFTFEEICQLIETGVAGNLHVGDYFDMDIAPIGKKRFVLAGFDCLLGEYKKESGEPCKHYAVVIPAGYLSALHNRDGRDSDWCTYAECKKELLEYEGILQIAFENHILHGSDNVKLKLMSAEQLWERGDGTEQLPLFREYPVYRRICFRPYFCIA